MPNGRPQLGELGQYLGIGQERFKRLKRLQPQFPSHYRPYQPSQPPVDPFAAQKAEYSQRSAELARLIAKFTGKQVVLPSVNISDIYARTRRQAEAAVNPYFQRQLNLFLQEQDLRRRQQEEEYRRGTEEQETGLQQYLEQAGIQRGRTQEDVATRLATLGETERLRQAQEAREFDIGRRGLQAQLGAGGLTLSGLGRQQLAEAGVTRRLGEEAATRQLTEQQREQEFLKTRTFEDLARGERIKGEAVVKEKGRLRFDLDRALESLTLQRQEKELILEQERRTGIFEEEARQRQTEFARYLSGLRGPEQVAEARKIYGGTF